MEIVMLIFSMIPVFILIIIGWLIKYKKAYYLISGYNTLPSEKKKNVDIIGLGRFTGNVCFAIGSIIFTAALFFTSGKMVLSGLVFSLLLPTIIYAVINAQKYDENTRNREGKMKKGTKVLISCVVIFLSVITIGVCILFYYSSKPADYTLKDGVLKISGMYGEKVPIYNISSLEIKVNLPDILYKTNGSNLGNIYKGYFDLKNIGSAKLFLDTSKPPFIFVREFEQLIIINCSNEKNTNLLYKKLYDEWKKTQSQ